MPDHGYVRPSHGHYPRRRAEPGICPSGKSYYVCAKGPFEGCCSTDPCSTGGCADYPRDASWKPSTAIETATSISSYTTTLTVTLSPLTTGGTATSTLLVTSDFPLVSSIISEISAISSITSSHSDTSVTANPSSTHLPSSTYSNTSASLSTPTPHPTSTPKAGTVAGIVLGTAGAIALLALLCCICYRRKKKTGWTANYSKSKEDKELEAQLKEAAEIQAERNKALRALENRRMGTDGVWASSPRWSTHFPGMRRDG